MKAIAGSLFLLLFGVFGSASGDTAVETDRAAFVAALTSRVEAKPSIEGDARGWFFLVKELRHLAAGRFWERPWEEVATNRSDPVPAILDFHQLLAARGVRLLLVPVPAKAAIYPEKLDHEFARGAAEPIAPFLDRIREGGVDVLDLEPLFLSATESSPDRQLYCSQDAHFSPEAARIVAEVIAGTLELRAGGGSGIVVSDPVPISITGDQVSGSKWEGVVPQETLAVQKVTNDGALIVPDAASSVLLLGDSHTLVFQAGAENGMHCRGAGVFDHLAARLGFAPDLVGVRGSGLVQARKQLFYKASATPDYWAGKKTVIWLFSVREFTQSPDRPIAVPLDRSPVGGREK